MKQAKWGSTGAVILIICLMLHFPISSSAISASESILQSTVVFTPQITPPNLTATVEAIAPSPIHLEPQPSPMPLPGASPRPTGTPEAGKDDKGGTDQFGYDYIEGSQPPTWMLWWDDEVLFFSPESPAEAALLDEYESQIDRITSGIDQIYKELNLRDELAVALFLDGFKIAGSGVVSYFACKAVPLTFWVKGGTGWICAGGVTVIIATIGQAGLKIKQIGDVNARLNGKQENVLQAYNDAESIFRDLVYHSQD